MISAKPGSNYSSIYFPARNQVNNGNNNLENRRVKEDAVLGKLGENSFVWAKDSRRLVKASKWVVVEASDNQVAVELG